MMKTRFLALSKIYSLQYND